MKQQSGMVTLLVTSMLLVGVLVLSLASYKNAYFLIKRASNDILSTQAHWLSEGGVECGYTQVMLKRKTPDMTSSDYYIDSCNKLGSQMEVLISGDDIYTITSKTVVGKKSSASISKSFRFIGGGASNGVIQSTANLHLDGVGGESTISPQPGELVNNEFNCIIANFSGDLTISGTLKNVGLNADKFHKNPPYNNFYSDHPNATCNSNHQSIINKDKKDVVTVYTEGDLQFKNDFVFDKDLDPFESLFGYKKKDWIQVKEKFKVVNNSNDCPGAITSALSPGVKTIWFEGNCDLGTDPKTLLEFKNKLEAVNGAVIVIENGIFGSRVPQTLNALFYQFVTPESTWKPSADIWNSTSLNGFLGNITDLSKLATYHEAAFHSSGGLVFDTPGLDAVMKGSFNFSFNGEVVKSSLPPTSGIPRWIEGSWHDF